MNLIDKIEQLDIQLFLYLNSKHNTTWDVIMYWITHKYTWIPLYIFLLFIVFKHFKAKIVYILIAIAILVTLSDQSSVLLKNAIQRYRPCHNGELQASVHMLRGKCGGKFGFVSSHAANTFALAMFLGMLFREKMKKNRPLLLLFLWAMIVSYSRIYAGVHYPLDIGGGMVLGITLAYLLFKVYQRIPNMKENTYH